MWIRILTVVFSNYETLDKSHHCLSGLLPHSFVPQMAFERLLCARHHSSSWGYIMRGKKKKKKKNITTPVKFKF